MQNPSCSASSRHFKEPLIGTAPRADYWLLLEYSQPYGKKAFAESGIPGEVKKHLSHALETIPNVRLQLIKKGTDSNSDGIAFFVAVNHEEQPNLYAFNMTRYEDLLDLDLSAIMAEKPDYWQYDRPEPLFLACTNARRDPCCARYGLPVFEALERSAGISAWQTSHLGGHRFAPVMVTLPHGAYYGRLAPEYVSDVVEAQNEGQVFLPNYRGRSCYEKHVQAAEFYLRREAEELDLYRFKLIEIETLRRDEWIFHFADLVNGQTSCVQIQAKWSSAEIFKSCREENPEKVQLYSLKDLQMYRGLNRFSK